MYQLGVMYMKMGDAEQAVRSFRAAVEHKLRQGRVSLGLMYASGQGVQRDFVQAYMWMDLAARQGIRQLSKTRAKLATAMTREQIADAESWARCLGQ
jgi:TPR repeat protein